MEVLAEFLGINDGKPIREAKRSKGKCFILVYYLIGVFIFIISLVLQLPEFRAIVEAMERGRSSSNSAQILEAGSQPEPSNNAPDSSKSKSIVDAKNNFELWKEFRGIDSSTLSEKANFLLYKDYKNVVFGVTAPEKNITKLVPENTGSNNPNKESASDSEDDGNVLFDI